MVPATAYFANNKLRIARAGLKNVYFLHDFVQKTRLWRLRQRQEAAISWRPLQSGEKIVEAGLLLFFFLPEGFIVFQAGG